jgi:transmembrane sensor
MTFGSPQDRASRDSVSPQRVAEAGVWISRLHGEQRGPAVESGLRRWLEESVENARALELATDVWEEAHNLRRLVRLVPAENFQRRHRSRFLLIGATLAVFVAAVALGLRWRESGVVTGVGEQRLLTLEDGTHVFLNTATRLVVRYDHDARRVQLKTGEALFTVEKRLGWPFLVTSGGQQVEALGTSFVVRRDPDRLAVTLVEGKVTVSAQKPDEAHPPDVVTLLPGQRLTLRAGENARLDRPSLSEAVAWRSGQVVLDDTSLADAVAEMNRYSPVKLVVDSPAAAGLLVNGLFQVGDSEKFANAIAQTYGLQVLAHGGRIVLTGTPRPPGSSSPPH